MTRNFLVLQGTASPFFALLSQALVSKGHSLTKVNFCGGDVLYGRAEDIADFTGTLRELPGWYTDLLHTKGISDVILFGDCRAIHRPIYAIAQSRGIAVHVFEEGYVRPDWITLELSGVNGRSKLPREPLWYLGKRSSTPSTPPAHPTGYNLFDRARHDITYRAANAALAHRFPRYKSHRPFNGLREYMGLAKRVAFAPTYKHEATQKLSDLVKSDTPYYFFPLQLNSDSQIIEHSTFASISDAIKLVLSSFAEHAPSQSSIVIKNHPLDTGVVNYRQFSTEIARIIGIEKRVVFLEAGHLPTMLDHARGVVVVNSTVGLSALHHNCPLITLGNAIYDMAGMTWQDGISDFWRHAEGPNVALYRSFIDYVIHHTQINGDFYTVNGMKMAVAGAVSKLETATRRKDQP